jgi:crotonobetainyl-CoA:carnitine CoA-transferase CaiB-like acyl-CoA transferase
MSGIVLSGVKVVEFATKVSGPYCGKLLGDLGADVIKIEPPEGDPARDWGPFPRTGPDKERSALFLYVNTSKRGITLDVEKAEGVELLKRLIQWADVLIDNHPPRYLEDLGLSWENISRLNPGLIYTSITPYGRTGPRANDDGDELTLVHAGGMGYLLPTRSEDISRPPVKMGGYAVGYYGALAAAVATMAALLGRRRSGKGQLIDISLQEVILAHVRGIAGARYHGVPWNRVPAVPPVMGRMQTSDGYILVAPFENHQWKAFVELMGNPEWLSGPEWDSMFYRGQHMFEVAPQIQEWMMQQKKEDLYHRGAQKGIPMGPINTVKDVLESQQYAARGYFVEVEHPVAGKYKYPGWPYQMSAAPARVSRPAPLLGQHNEEVLCSVLGYSKDEFQRLQKLGIVKRMTEGRR